MRRFIYTSIIVAVSLLSTSCHWLVSWAPPEFEPRKIVETGFIYNYFHIDENLNIECEALDDSVVIDFSAYRGDEYAVNVYLDTPGEIYTDYMEKYGDQVGFEETDMQDIACAESIKGIDIISLQEWNEDYPAQSSLNNIFEVEYATYKYFVESGFDEAFDVEERERTERKRVSELQEDDMWFIHTDFCLICNTLPNDDRAHRLKITLSLDTGEEITYNVNVN